MATQWGVECWCSRDGSLDYDRHGDTGVCDYPCIGDEVGDTSTIRNSKALLLCGTIFMLLTDEVKGGGFLSGVPPTVGVLPVRCHVVLPL